MEKNINQLKTVSRASIADQAEAHIRTMVLDGTLQAGERLNEVAIAGSINISRGPLREAIKRLSGQGYLTIETHRGAFVKQFQPQEIIDLYDLRCALELYAVRLAIRRADQLQVEALVAKLEQVESTPKQVTGSAPYVAEFDFHERLVELGGNLLIQTQLADANRKLALALAPTAQTAPRKRHAVSAHLEIAHALAHRAEEHCVNLLGSHLMDSMNNSLRVLGLASEVVQSQEAPNG